jgi:hypothetical protein
MSSRRPAAPDLLEIGTGFGLAIPVDILRRLVREGGYEPVPPRGSG